VVFLPNALGKTDYLAPGIIDAIGRIAMEMRSPPTILTPTDETSLARPLEPDFAPAPISTPTILTVDDDARSRKLLTTLLEAEGYATREAGDGVEALRIVAENPPDLVLLDVMMPGMNGYAVVQRLKKVAGTKAVPVILISALSDRESRLRGLEAGAEEFLHKPVDRVELKVRVRNLLRLKAYADFLREHNRILDQRVEEKTALLRESHLENIVTLSRAAEYKDPETGAHIKRISYYTKELALSLGEGTDFADRMFYASPMHDIGKIGIPDHVLLKTGGFTSLEWGVMRSHTTIGWEILRHGATPYTQLGAEIALTHHERWDGSGYPNAWRGEQIPLSGRIMNICDQYDALRSKRPYKEALDHPTVMKIITEGDGRTSPAHFEPRILESFTCIAARFDQIFETNKD
jgi:putative two-component system response regulator